MERLAEQIVAWHNRHPLARRITVGDVHTIGVVALPFVRASAQASGMVEPVLTDSVGFDELLGSAPVSRFTVWRQRLARLAKLARRSANRRQDQWRAFNEKFLPGLSPGRVERFALAHGFAEPPAAPETRPWRVIVIDDKLASARTGWPFELYLTTAGIDAGSGRSRVLAGRGIPSQIIGRRLWSPMRLALAAGMVALLLGGGAWLLWPQAAEAPAAAEPAARLASAPAVATAPARPAASVPWGSASAASSADAAASAAPEAATMAARPASEIASDEPGDESLRPDIRPRLVQRTDGIVRPPLRSSKPAEGEAPAVDKAAEKPAEKTADKPAKIEAAADATPERRAGGKAAEPVDPRLARLAQSPPKTVVALVGPPGTKAEAEAMLKRMQAGLEGVHSDPDALQADIIQTPDGWRATIWPFPSREQAQLINATLIARGMKTKAVNF